MNPTDGPDLRTLTLPRLDASAPVHHRAADAARRERHWPFSPTPYTGAPASRDGFAPVLPGPFRRATSERLTDEAARSRAIRCEDARHLLGQPHDADALLPVLRATYGDALEHPGLHVLSGAVDLDRLPIGQWDESSPLRAVLLCPPLGLHTDQFALSPKTAARAGRPLEGPASEELELRRALLASHDQLVRAYLGHGVQVFLALLPESASQAVFTTDPVAVVGPLALRTNPRHDVRRLEMRGYIGGIPTSLYDAGAPVEGGDLLLAGTPGHLVLLQGLDSLRSNDASIDVMGRLLQDQRHRLGTVEHLVVPLRQHMVPGQAEGTLHLDYVVGYAGGAARRVLVVAPAGLADSGRSIENLQAKLRVHDRDVVEVTDDDAVIAGATNFVNLNPREVLFNDVEASRPVQEALRKRGLVVHPIDLAALSEFDGTTRCASARLLRA